MSKATINNRIQLRQIEVQPINDKESRIELVLSLNEHSESVEKVGSSDKAIELMTIGLATLDCIKILLSRPLECHIDYIKQVPGKQNHNTIETLLRLREKGKETYLNGNALIIESIHKATVESLLNALSSTLEKMVDLQQKRERTDNARQSAIANLSTIITENNIAEKSSIKSTDSKKADDVNIESLPTSEEDPLNDLIKISKAKELFDKAEALIRKTNYIVAKEILREAINLDKTRAEYHCQLGITLSNLKEIEEAEKSLLKATEIDPNLAICYTELGLFYKEVGRIDKSQIALEKAVELGSDARAKRALVAVKELIVTFDPAKERFEKEKQDLKAITASLKLKDDQNNQSDIRKTLSRQIDRKTIAIFIGSIVFLIFAGIGSLYFYNYWVMSTQNKVPEAELASPRYIALKIVKDFPSTTKGLSVGEQIDKYIKEQSITEYDWISAPNKDGQYIVAINFNKNGKYESAVWIVDLAKKVCKAESPLAKDFSSN
ncbi:MAG: hypothetical protein WAQ98_32590 [Blastocatellia bacterium]